MTRQELRAYKRRWRVLELMRYEACRRQTPAERYESLIMLAEFSRRIQRPSRKASKPDCTGGAWARIRKSVLERA
ncbi:MAG: hypothetical protein M5U26_02865 [Planctomycetota bacterium]|nr:hypothetical protein [Planctomycetota bacterium]